MHTPEKGQENSARRGKLRRASSMAYALGVGPKLPTEAQRQKLFNLLGGMDYAPSPIEIESYVRWANAGYSERLTRVHFINAIDMRLNGVNSWGTEEQLARYSWGDDVEFTPYTGEMKRRLIARAKAMKAAKYQSPTRALNSSVKKSASDTSPKSYAEFKEAQRVAAMEALARSRARKPG